MTEIIISEQSHGNKHQYFFEKIDHRLYQLSDNGQC
jgi:hypothetical protein